MENHWRTLFSLLPSELERKLYNNYFIKEDAEKRKSADAHLPSNLAKHNALRSLQQKFKTTILVETGTYMGDTLYALYNEFDKLYSIELSELFYAKAVKRFRNYPKINLINGDSGRRLFELVPNLKERSLFWLDGHYSGGLTAKGDKECPVYEELAAIFKSPLEHVIVIDDARLFIGENDYPALNDLKEFVNKHKPAYTLTVENDGIRLLPKA
jgi:hypothetical protein